MAKYMIEIRVPKAQLEDAEKHLVEGYSFDDSEEVVYCWTGKFENGIEVDVKVVDARKGDSTPWSEAVLFSDGNEIGCSEVSDSVIGDWYFFDIDGDDYTVWVGPEEG